LNDEGGFVDAHRAGKAAGWLGFQFAIEFNDQEATMFSEPLGADDSAVGPIDGDNVRETLRALRKCGAAFQNNLLIEDRLAGLGTDQRDGNAMARRAVRLNATVIVLGARIAAIIVTARLARSGLRMNGRRNLRRRRWLPRRNGLCHLRRRDANSLLLRWHDDLGRLARLDGSRLGKSRRRFRRACAAVISPMIFDQLRLRDPAPAKFPALVITAIICFRVATIAFAVENGDGIDF
jgi:hypothetical protein